MKITDHIYFYQERTMLDCNTYVIKAAKTMIVDVGLDRKVPALLRQMEEDGIDPASVDFIVNTHLHLDHTCGNQVFKEKAGGAILLAPIQKEHYRASVHEATRFFGLEPVDFQEDGVLTSLLDLGGLDIETIPTPGHAPDGICFYCAQEKFLISGDLLFDHNTGRSDLPGGSGEVLKQSIEEIAERDIEILLPGHMGIITDRKGVQANFQFVRDNVFRWL